MTQPVGPAIRILRTVVMVVLSLGASIPAAVALLPISADTAAAAVGIAGAVVVLVTALWNGVESKTGHTLIASGPAVRRRPSAAREGSQAKVGRKRRPRA